MTDSPEYLRLKLEKTKVKSAFTRTKNTLLNLIEDAGEKNVEKRDIREALEKLNDKYDLADDILVKMIEIAEDKEKLINELAQLEEEQKAAHLKVEQMVDERKSDKSIMISVMSKEEIISRFNEDVQAEHIIKKADEYQDKKNTNHDQQLWKRLERVTLPTFTGDKLQYQNWKSAFTACIDTAPTSDEYKLLQLKQYLKGDALKAIENLGHSAIAYSMAKERLERKFGGTRRIFTTHLEEWEKLNPIKDQNAKDIERLADLLDVTVTKLKESGHENELSNGMLYSKILQKLPQSLITQYYRWISDKSKIEGVVTLREFIIQESEYYTIADEAVNGIANIQPDFINRTHFVDKTMPSNKNTSPDRNCKLCNQSHEIWHCNDFKKMSVSNRWSTAKRLNLCYRCLNSSHLGNKCKLARTCNLDGCPKNHNRLLHDDRPKNTENIKPSERAHTTLELSVDTYDEQSEHTNTACTNKREAIALRTVPIYLKNEKKESW